MAGSLVGEKKNLCHSICSASLKLKVTSNFVDSQTENLQPSKFGVSNSAVLWKQSTATSNAKGSRLGEKDEFSQSDLTGTTNQVRQKEMLAYTSTGRKSMLTGAANRKAYSLSNEVSLGQPSSSIKSSTLTNYAKEVTHSDVDHLKEGSRPSCVVEAPPLTSEVKKKTRVSNFIVCLYYNMASCYQRLGLLEEAVEMLEMASD